MKRFLFPLACAFAVSLPAFAQTNTNAVAGARRGGGQAPMRSPEVNADHSVTFRFRAPGASNVVVSGEWNNWRALNMTKDDRGVWSVTTPALEPDIYAYYFRIDGVTTLDPANMVFKPARSIGESLVDIQRDKPGLQDFQDVPHGTVRMLEYRSKTLGDRIRNLRVYTPPDYDKNPTAKYPVFYLFHGAGDNEGTWTGQGRAHYIVDNLIAQGKARPMIIVMPDGTMPPNPVTAANAGTDARLGGVSLFDKEIFNDLIPFIEANYRIKSGAENRAINGLSMGGGQALTVGLRHTDYFGFVGGMSSAIPNQDFALAEVVKDTKAANQNLKLLWFGCGRSDSLFAPNKQFDDTLTKNGIKHSWVESEGFHAWPVWRKYLAQFVPEIFPAK